MVAFDSFDCPVIGYDLKAVKDEVEKVYSQNTAAAVAAAAAVDVSDDEVDLGRHTEKEIRCSLTPMEKVVVENSWTAILCGRMILHSSKGVHVSYAA